MRIDHRSASAALN